MQGVLAGFATIGAIISLGFVLAQLKVVDENTQRVLASTSFVVAGPALMVTVLGATDVHHLLTTNLIATLGAVGVTAVIYALLARSVWKRRAGDTVIGTFASSYANAGNLGLPIAAYVLGDAALVAPLLLAQQLALQPAGLAALDAITTRGDPDEPRMRILLRRISAPVRNPLTIGSLVGLALSITGLDLPQPVADPIALVGGMAVPTMLIAFGISLRLGPRLGAGEPPAQVGAIVALKLILQPVAAYVIGAYVVGLSGGNLLAVTVIAALPTAQNVFTYSMRYECGVSLARESIFVSTLLCVPILIIITSLLA